MVLVLPSDHDLSRVLVHKASKESEESDFRKTQTCSGRERASMPRRGRGRGRGRGGRPAGVRKAGATGSQTTVKAWFDAAANQPTLRSAGLAPGGGNEPPLARKNTRGGLKIAHAADEADAAAPMKSFHSPR